MALTVSDMHFQLVGTQTNALDLGTVSLPISYLKNFSWTSGTGANQADAFFFDQRTLAASATEDLDLYGGLTNAFGATINFAKVKAVIVYAATGNTNSVQVTRKATTGIPMFMADGDGISLLPGALFAFVSPNATGVAVTDSTDDTITVTNSAGSTSVTYDILIVGVSA